MRFISTALLSLLLTSTAFGKEAIEAMYVVPVPQELAAYSRFAVKIDQPYLGAISDTLGYTFPEELTGLPVLSVQLHRIPGTKNDWESSEMKASCAEVEENFTCNMYLRKSTRGELVAPLSLANTAKFLATKNLAPAELTKKLLVAENFFSSEPAGILTYKF